MTNSQVLVSTRSTLPAPATEAAGHFDVELRRAQAIAGAGDMIPTAYRGKPGAVILAQQWADSRGVDLLTTMQTVAFVQGKPVIDATMQRALAAANGFDVRVIQATSERAAVKVTRNGEDIGEAAYSIEDAHQAGLTNKDNWKKDPTAMLVARATTRAVRWFAPSVLLGVFVGDEVDDATDPVQVLTPAAEPEPEPTPEPADIVDAVVVEPEPIDAAEVVAEPEQSSGLDTSDPDALIAAIKAAGLRQADAIRTAQDAASSLGEDGPGSVQQIAKAAPEIRMAVAAWIANAGGQT